MLIMLMPQTDGTIVSEIERYEVCPVALTANSL
jgi:hypothetical protein